jgi:hypothetical protein
MIPLVVVADTAQPLADVVGKSAAKANHVLFRTASSAASSGKPGLD